MARLKPYPVGMRGFSISKVYPEQCCTVQTDKARKTFHGEWTISGNEVSRHDDGGYTLAGRRIRATGSNAANYGHGVFVSREDKRVAAEKLQTFVK